MCHTVQDVLKILEHLGDEKNYKRLNNIIKANIPLYGYQANLLFLKRSYGKTYMSYCLAFTQLKEALEDKDTVIIGEDILPQDPDLIEANSFRIQEWFKGFKEFIEQYYKSVELDIYASCADKLVYRKV